MADLHLRALMNSPEAIARGESWASLDHLTPAGEAALRLLRTRYRTPQGAVYLHSKEAAEFADAALLAGLLVRYN